jgi:hypothetical protein
VIRTTAGTRFLDLGQRLPLPPVGLDLALSVPDLAEHVGDDVVLTRRSVEMIWFAATLSRLGHRKDTRAGEVIGN